MSSLHEHHEHDFPPIPAVLHSFASGQPFQECVMCQSLLADGSSPYIIEKAIRNYPEAKVQDVVFEYAMCMPCAQRMHEELSAESKANIAAFFQEKVDLEARRAAIFALPDPLNLDHWISHCLVTGIPREACTEYQVYGLCQGTGLQYEHMPYLISGQAMDQMQELISAHTRQIMDDFLDSQSGLPPELRALLLDRLVLL